MGDSNPQSLKQIFQEMLGTEVGVIEAQVVSASPLRVQATNDEKLVLSVASLVVPRHLTDYTTTATFSLASGGIDAHTEGNGRHTHSGGAHGGHLGGSGDHTHGGDGEHGHHLVSFALSGGTITVHNALKVGEIVYLLPYNSGKKYYILDRRE